MIRIATLPSFQGMDGAYNWSKNHAWNFAVGWVQSKCLSEYFKKAQWPAWMLFLFLLGRGDSPFMKSTSINNWRSLGTIQRGTQSRPGQCEVQDPKTRRTQEPKNPRTQEPKNPRTQEPKNPRTQEPKNPDCVTFFKSSCFTRYLVDITQGASPS